MRRAVRELRHSDGALFPLFRLWQQPFGSGSLGVNADEDRYIFAADGQSLRAADGQHILHTKGD